MPGLKWIFNPALAKGEHAVKLTDEVMGCLEMPLSSPRGPHRKTEGSLPLGFFLLCEEESKRNADEDTDAALTDEPETLDDELLDPLAVQALPEVDQGVFAPSLRSPRFSGGHGPLGPGPKGPGPLRGHPRVLCGPLVPGVPEGSPRSPGVPSTTRSPWPWVPPGFPAGPHGQVTLGTVGPIWAPGGPGSPSGLLGSGVPRHLRYELRVLGGP